MFNNCNPAVWHVPVCSGPAPTDFASEIWGTAQPDPNPHTVTRKYLIRGGTNSVACNRGNNEEENPDCVETCASSIRVGLFKNPGVEQDGRDAVRMPSFGKMQDEPAPRCGYRQTR
ncbi:hypothetical protein CCM_07437 [Cordyceps militaris CM01]|uniref:Uncharacterized protein n=1 Tax=Cordyceps militaris (strain CM01) TaxID=983644 RepID=G3JPT4_CORMM|nr:uncharacterized protein CCM_07437 [Cordyceps militaris CM01]EGX89185.1 hypothetical protein CCM_07437 [Cordyceps militaris CM01]